MKPILVLSAFIFSFACADGQTSTVKVKKNCGCDTSLIKFDLYSKNIPIDTLLRPGHIKGRVFSADGGRILKGAIISVSTEDSVYASVKTNKTGTYELEKIPQGKYTLKCCAVDHKSILTTIEFYSGMTIPKDFRLETCK